MRIAPRTSDDQAIAAVVGFVLVLAILATVGAHELREVIPRNGRAAEEAWADELARALQLLSATPHQGRERAVVALPSAQHGEGVWVGARVEPIVASGTASFRPDCASLSVRHVVANATVVDLDRGARGCLDVTSDGVYGAGFHYRIELGGLLRVQKDGAVVLQGPPLHMSRSAAGELNLTLGLVSLEGAGAATDLRDGAQVTLVARAQAGERTGLPNADEATVELVSQHPAAWADWFRARFVEAGVPGPGPAAAFDIACVPATCAPGADGLGSVTVTVRGEGDTTRDLALALPYSAYHVTLG